MIDYPEAIWNKAQLTEHLIQITSLFRSPIFRKTALFNRQSQTCWIELIRAIDELVRQALLTGKRIDFTDEVSIHNEQQDITSLLQSMRQSAYLFNEEVHPHLIIMSPALNHVYGVGRGHFANGLSFRCIYEDELTFFVGYDRIYFYRHLMRAFIEARRYLKSLSEHL